MTAAALHRVRVCKCVSLEKLWKTKQMKRADLFVCIPVWWATERKFLLGESEHTYKSKKAVCLGAYKHLQCAHFSSHSHRMTQFYNF